jgi:hypothetical protein
MNTCAVCAVVSNHRCSRCHTVFYCSSEHQKRHWTIHKKSCGDLGEFKLKVEAMPKATCPPPTLQEGDGSGPSNVERRSDGTKSKTSRNAGHCSVCDVGSTLRCAKCYSVFYCSSEHQKQHWKAHKKTCGKLSTLRLEARPDSARPPPALYESDGSGPYAVECRSDGTYYARVGRGADGACMPVLTGFDGKWTICYPMQIISLLTQSRFNSAFRRQLRLHIDGGHLDGVVQRPGFLRSLLDMPQSRNDDSGGSSDEEQGA